MCFDLQALFDICKLQKIYLNSKLTDKLLWIDRPSKTFEDERLTRYESHITQLSNLLKRYTLKVKE